MCLCFRPISIHFLIPTYNSEQRWLPGGKKERLSELFCAVLCTTVVHSDTHTYEQFLTWPLFRFTPCGRLWINSINLFGNVHIFEACSWCGRTNRLTYSALTLCQEDHPVGKNWAMRYWHGICLQWGANHLHMVQLMPPSPHHLLQKQPNQSRCRFGRGLGWVQQSIISARCTLAPPGEYVHVRRRCSLFVTNYSDHLSHSWHVHFNLTRLQQLMFVVDVELVVASSVIDGNVMTLLDVSKCVYKHIYTRVCNKWQGLGISALDSIFKAIVLNKILYALPVFILDTWLRVRGTCCSECCIELAEADTLTIWLGATPSGLTNAHLHHPPIFFTGQMPFLSPNQQCQRNEGNYLQHLCTKRLVTLSTYRRYTNNCIYLSIYLNS